MLSLPKNSLAAPRPSAILISLTLNGNVCSRELPPALLRGGGGSAGVDGGSAPGTSDGHVETSLRLVSDTDDEAECVIRAPRSDGVESKLSSML